MCTYSWLELVKIVKQIRARNIRWKRFLLLSVHRVRCPLYFFIFLFETKKSWLVPENSDFFSKFVNFFIEESRKICNFWVQIWQAFLFIRKSDKIVLKNNFRSLHSCIMNHEPDRAHDNNNKWYLFEKATWWNQLNALTVWNGVWFIKARIMATITDGPL